MHQAAARELVAILDSHATDLQAPILEIGKALAAAGLWRCRSLLLAMCALTDAGRDDATGTLLRQMFEVWLVALTLLTANDEAAVLELFGDQVHSLEKMRPDDLPGDPADKVQVRTGLANLKAYVQQGGGRVAARRDYRTMADALVRSGVALHAVEWYDQLYRAESLNEAHGNLGTLQRYLRVAADDASFALVENPGEAYPEQLKVAVGLTGSLTAHALRAFNVPDSRLDSLAL